MNEYLESLLSNEDRKKKLRENLIMYKKSIRKTRCLLFFYSFLLLIVFLFLEAGIGWWLFTNFSNVAAASVFIAYQISIIVFFYLYVLIYYWLRNRNNKKVNNFLKKDYIYGIYRDLWSQVRKKLASHLNLSSIYLNNISSLYKYIKNDEYSINDGEYFDETTLGINSIVFFDEGRKVTTYSMGKKNRFIWFLFPFLVGNLTIANKPSKRLHIDDEIYDKCLEFGPKKRQKYKYATFINIKFATASNWLKLKRSITREDLKYLAKRGIYLNLSDWDMHFTFLEKHEFNFSPGISIFSPSGRLSAYNLNKDKDFDEVIRHISLKAEYDINSFIVKYFIINWFVQKYRGRSDKNSSYLIDSLKKMLELNNDI